MSINKLQTAFEQQFFSHLISSEFGENQMQADDLTVIKKYKEYVVIKRSLTQCYSRMKCFTYLTLLISIAMLTAEIFDLINMD